MIRSANNTDTQAITDIYNYFVLNTVVTFEEESITNDEMAQRIRDVQNSYVWLVYELNGRVVGYAYAGRWKVRSAYRHTVESSIYLDPSYTGKGIGKQLYEALIEELHTFEIHAVIGGAALPNEASVRLHESMGFKKIGHFEEVGFKFGRWVDVGYWQLILDQPLQTL
jgi:L-amino acid N-acyltransferase YncA